MACNYQVVSYGVGSILKLCVDSYNYDGRKPVLACLGAPETGSFRIKQNYKWFALGTEAPDINDLSEGLWFSGSHFHR